MRFTVTDGRAQVPVTYTGALPDLFREGQGVVAAGELDSRGVFAASEVLRILGPNLTLDSCRLDRVLRRDGRQSRVTR